MDFAILAIAARGLAAAGFVGGVVALMERASPFIGGIVLALPIVTAPAYVFIILHQEPGFVAQAALGSLATVGSVLLFLVTAIALVGRLPMTAVLIAALGAWLATGLIIRALPAALHVVMEFEACSQLPVSATQTSRTQVPCWQFRFSAQSELLTHSTQMPWPRLQCRPNRAQTLSLVQRLRQTLPLQVSSAAQSVDARHSTHVSVPGLHT